MEVTQDIAGRLLLTTLVVKVAIAATLATMLVRFGQFRRILLTEKRAWRERLTFTVAFGIPVSIGVVLRLLLGYDAADLSLAGAFLAGLIAGPYAGAIVGCLVGVPALIANEWIAIILAVGCGFAGGGLRELSPKEAIWHVTPLLVTALHRHAWKLFGRFRIDWQITLLAAPICLELLRQGLGLQYGTQRLFYLHVEPTNVWLSGLVVLTTVLSVAVPIKIWNTARIEHRLQEQEKLLMTARIEALASQINPHFLFNTLTSISSLIRSQPETARMLIGKLSGLLRRLLRSQEHFVTLREELASIDEYLDIETVRFGPTLVVEKQITPETLDQMVPSMLLQPLVENSIKHGISRKVGGGRITISSERTNGHTVIEVIDDGLGMRTDKPDQDESGGIGLRNVDERLRVIYGANYHLKLSSAPGEGTCARIEIPELVVPQQASA
ncbi:MAG: sensor histidine kinase [Acidobacteria bacterium]|jgi:two-component system LytT family sensor kinase|nr:sensor histidine kinase [Acidobacteriota bacterium]HJN45290.1 histidine kinase [Vicinamibacterales bacterium]|tara:strand:- start:280 stop:1602 length:1323 start_codon:yes stop_codon:yes gene_type:complete